MTIGLLKEIIEKMPQGARLLGIDVGKKTLGLAICDPEMGLATPLSTIIRKKFSKDVLALKKVITDYEIGGYVLGLPLNIDGSEGPKCQSVRDFAIELAKRDDIVGQDPWIALHDERFSTVSAENYVDGSVKRRKAKETGVIDKLAAKIILQSAVDTIQEIENKKE